VKVNYPHFNVEFWNKTFIYKNSIYYLLGGAFKILKKEKGNVQQFYNDFGWHKNSEGVYNDTRFFTDCRPVTDFYSQKTSMRVKPFLRSTGEYFLDAGCGAYPNLKYSFNNKKHVCIDLSKRGLEEARSKLKKKGVYVLADITRMPFRDCVFSATLAAHILYHIPQDEQDSAVQELQRTLKSGSSCVIIYSCSGKWSLSLGLSLLLFLK